MALQRISTVLLVLTLLMPVYGAYLIPAQDDDVVCELLEDFTEEEGDDKGDSTIEGIPFFRQHFFGLEPDLETSETLASYFCDHKTFLKDITLKNSTPPPEWI